MLSAVHKETGKHVSAFMLTNDATWIGKEREEFLAPKHEIGNWLELQKKGIEEVVVCFVIAHKRKNPNSEQEEFVQQHFRIVTEGAVENIENESEEHKLAKETIYSKAIANELVIDGHPLSEFSIKDIYIERPVGKKRADVLIELKEFHQIYGRGFAFEIQISPQNEERTRERTFDRAGQGYSVVWIWGDELDGFNYDKIKSVPFLEASELFKKEIKKDYNFIMNNAGQQMESKIHEFKQEAELTSARVVNELQDKIKRLSPEFSQLQKQVNEFKQETYDAMDKLVKEAREHIAITVSKDLSPRIEKSIEEEVKSKMYNQMIAFLESNLKTTMDSLIKENVSKLVLPIEVYEGMIKLFDEHFKELDWQDWYKQNMFTCVKCKECGKMIPLGDVYWTGGASRYPLCYEHFKERKNETKKSQSQIS